MSIMMPRARSGVFRQSPKALELAGPTLLAGNQIVIPGSDRIRLDGEAVALLAQAQRFRCFLSLGNIAVNTNHLERLARCVITDERAGADPAHGAIRSDDAEFGIEEAARRRKVRRVIAHGLAIFGMDQRKKQGA